MSLDKNTLKVYWTRVIYQSGWVEYSLNNSQTNGNRECFCKKFLIEFNGRLNCSDKR